MSDARVWLITGVSSGLGRALAEMLLARGATVFGTLRDPAAKRMFDEHTPGRSRGIVLDVTDTAAIARVVAEAGPIDVLVNNAGYGFFGAIEATGLDAMRAQFETNVFGAVMMMQAVLPGMRQRRAGRIINVSSVSGRVGWPGLGIYTGCKFALTGISDTLAMEVAPLGIKVTAIEPGGLRTDWSGRSLAWADGEIADYDATVGQSQRIMNEHRGHAPGDPVRAAQAILHVADLDDPPSRLLLGTDALQYARHELERLRDNLNTWESLSASIAFPD